CYEPDDLFEMMERGMKAKIQMMRKYPDITAFVIKAFYEKEPGICPEIQKSYREHFGLKAQGALSRVNPDDFVPGLNLEVMYREMYLASEGYLWEIFQRGDEMDVSKLEKDFKEMLSFWKNIYLRKR
ncbi:MAG: TetR/AcrR family transcriptional regulator, partial [Lachnospiraceae bacterium]|nr:TetR/AcrR family transcriptional regulator [Lachnospiraceae bacterium]